MLNLLRIHSNVSIDYFKDKNDAYISRINFTDHPHFEYCCCHE